MFDSRSLLELQSRARCAHSPLTQSLKTPFFATSRGPNHSMFTWVSRDTLVADEDAGCVPLPETLNRRGALSLLEVRQRAGLHAYHSWAQTSIY